MRTKNPIFALAGHSGAVNCIEAQQSEPQFISGSMDKMVLLLRSLEFPSSRRSLPIENQLVDLSTPAPSPRRTMSTRSLFPKRSSTQQLCRHSSSSVTVPRSTLRPPAGSLLLVQYYNSLHLWWGWVDGVVGWVVGERTSDRKYSSNNRLCI